jgi:hypothetical protein
MLKYGQEITIFPVEDFHAVKGGDIVYVQWRGSSSTIGIIRSKIRNFPGEGIPPDAGPCGKAGAEAD